MTGSCQWLFLEPVDVLYLRGNRLFGEAGSYGEAQMPPWPSVAAGALRSRILADQGVDLAAFRDGKLDDGAVTECLGTPADPARGRFRLAALLGGWREASGRIQPLLPAPADLVVKKSGSYALLPFAGTTSGSNRLPMQLSLAAPAGKAKTGQWLTAAAIRAWLGGQTPAADQLVPSSYLWARDHRVGLALDAGTRTAVEGALFATDAVAPRSAWNAPAEEEGPARLPAGNFGFLVGVTGAEGLLPTTGLVRFGGDGRAAAVYPAEGPPPADFEAIAAGRRFRLVLITPGLFPAGWCPFAIGAAHRVQIGVHSARLCAAAVPRAGVVSGWDLARWQPKTALRCAPAGSVYWFDEFTGSATDLANLQTQCVAGAGARIPEGFNQGWVGAWPENTRS